jgi:short-subunit dehydrogenase
MWNLRWLVLIIITHVIQCMEIQRQKVIVVGASTGIGREIAKVFGKQEYDLGICSRKIDLLETLQEEISTKVYIEQIDLMEIETVEEKLQRLVDKLGGLDLIIVNAGIAPEGQAGGLLPENKQIPFEWISDTINVNVLGCSAAFNFAVNYFIAQNKGHIVGISSIDAIRGLAGGPAYCASKSFMATYLEGLRNKFVQLNIPINVTEIRPGPIRKADEQKKTANAYWTVTPEDVALDIYDCIVAQYKVAYVPRRWQLIAWLLMVTPDWLYNWMGGF